MEAGGAACWGSSEASSGPEQDPCWQVDWFVGHCVTQTAEDTRLQCQRQEQWGTHSNGRSQTKGGRGQVLPVREESAIRKP